MTLGSLKACDVALALHLLLVVVHRAGDIDGQDQLQVDVVAGEVAAWRGQRSGRRGERQAKQRKGRAHQSSSHWIYPDYRKCATERTLCGRT